MIDFLKRGKNRWTQRNSSKKFRRFRYEINRNGCSWIGL